MNDGVLRRRSSVDHRTALALVSSTRMPSRLKSLAELKASTVIGCEYCVDIGSAAPEARAS